MYRRITWTATTVVTYSATVWVPDEWLCEGEVEHLDELVESSEHAGHYESGEQAKRQFIESHPVNVEY